MRKKSFRSSVTIMALLSALIPAALFSTIAIIQNVSLLRESSLRELHIQTEGLAKAFEMEVESLSAELIAATHDSDIQRAERIPIFITKADFILNRIKSQHPVVEMIYFFDRNNKLVTAMPNENEWTFRAHSGTQPPAECLESSDNNSSNILADNNGLWLRSALSHPITEATSGHLCVLARWDTLAERLAQRMKGSSFLQRLEVNQNTVWQHLVNSDVRTLKESIQLPTLATLQLTVAEPVTSWAPRFYILVSLLLLATAAVVIAIVFLTSRASTRLLSPFDQLNEFINKYAIGEYRTAAPELPYQEFQTAVTTLENMGQHVLNQLENIKRINELERFKTQAEMDALKSQLRPHLIFNSLNSILSAIRISPELAINMILKLSDLYRLILNCSKDSLHPLEEELKIVSLYLELEHSRHQDRLAFSLTAPANILQVRVPPLLIQTLVENSVKHGINPSLTGGEIRVIIEEHSNETLTVRVQNTGAPLPLDIKHNVGLTNTIRRLDLAYANQHCFRITTEGKWTVAQFDISKQAGLT
ncbi:MAG: sensor histidine kinase [Pseudobdellovibrionaceae bacterium]